VKVVVREGDGRHAASMMGMGNVVPHQANLTK